MAGEDKVVLITGAGSGIGRACALALDEAGYRLVLAGRRPEPLEQLASETQSQALVVPTDVSDRTSVEALFARIEERWGRIDVLFNNAGTFGSSAELGDLPEATWRTVVDVNLTGTYFCSQAAFRMMKRQRPRGGRIINNGSISAHSPRPGSAAYTATKHAISGLTKSTALDGRPYDIACGQIDIGNAATEMTGAIQTGVPQADGSVVAEPVMSVDNVARAVVFMAGLPLDANVPSLTVMATRMPFIGRG